MPLSPVNLPPIRLGFVQLWDAAPILVAGAEGFFAQLDLQVEVTRELGWTTIREKLLLGELDFAHALGPMPLAASAGVGHQALPCVGLGVLNRNGNGITVARQYWDAGIRSEDELAAYIRQERWRKRFVFGVVNKVSSHHFLMLQWLDRIGLSAQREVEIVQLPPGQFIRNLDAGTIDAACIGEPWNSLAVLSRAGWIATDSVKLAPDHPEKTLMATRREIELRPERAARLLAALLAGAERCADPAFQPRLIDILSARGALNLSRPKLRECLKQAKGPSPLAQIRFHGQDLPAWSASDFDWIAQGVRRAGLSISEKELQPRSMQWIYPSALIKSAQKFLPALRPST